jgi:ribosomal-protein-alanine N-acetyltransferase
VSRSDASAAGAEPGGIGICTVADLDAVMDIERASSARPWPRGAFRYELEARGAQLLLARDAGGRPVAYAGYRVDRDEASLLNLATHPAHRRRGYARALLERVVASAGPQGARLIRLEVRRSNTAAIRLYERLGFRVLGRRPMYYDEGGEDALLMVRAPAGP